MSLFSRIAHRMVDELTEQMRLQGFDDLRPAHSAVFENLGPDPVGTRLVDLAALAQMTPQSMSELVNTLESLGYVERVPDPDDGRSRRIRLTERGHAAGQAARLIMRTVDAHWIEAIGFPPGRVMHLALERAMEVDDVRRTGSGEPRVVSIGERHDTHTRTQSSG